MARGLLLGNGINSRLCIWDLSVKNIADRFKKNVLVYSIIINNIFSHISNLVSYKIYI